MSVMCGHRCVLHLFMISPTWLKSQCTSCLRIAISFFNSLIGLKSKSFALAVKTPKTVSLCSNSTNPSWCISPRSTASSWTRVWGRGHKLRNAQKSLCSCSFLKNRFPQRMHNWIISSVCAGGEVDSRCARGCNLQRGVQGVQEVDFGLEWVAHLRM